MISINARILNGPISGVQRYLLSIIEELNKILYGSSVKTIYSERNGFSGHLWEQSMLPFKVSAKDVLWSPSNTGPLFCPAKQVVTIHDFATLDHPEWTSWKFNALYSQLLPKLASRVDSIIAISDYTKSRILNYVDIEESKIKVIKNGVEERFFIKATDANFLNVISKYKIKTNRYILSVSSIEPRKNIVTLLKAWEKIQDQLDDDVWLVLVGKQNTKIFADAGLANIPPRVHFTGFVDDIDLPVLYQHAQLFTYISLYEGFGLPPLEAMAAGVPVITSNTTSIPEVVADKAIKVNPISVNEVADNILHLMQHESLRLKIGNAGIEHASQFSWQKTAEQTFNLLKSFE